MKSLRLSLLCGRIAGIPHNRGIRTDAVLLSRLGKKNLRLPYEPGVKHKELVLEEDFSDVEHEAELDQVPDLMNLDKSYDSHHREIRKNKKKLSYVITAKKFFKPRAEPLTLTCNDRLCIRFLHQQDPVQWNLKTLSESFPATTQTIKKIIRQKWKITPERAKVLDERVAKNWELLKEEKLDADPHVLQHLKKFINRKPVLLEQIKNEKFYLPEVKTEPVWNSGEFSGILAKYERIIKNFMNETQEGQNPKMLEDGKPQDKVEECSLDIIKKKIEEEVSIRNIENKDSFIFKELALKPESYATLHELENQIIQKAETRGNLSITEKAILDKKLGVVSESKLNELTASKSVSSDVVKQKHLEKKEIPFVESNRKNKAFTNKNNRRVDRMVGSETTVRIQEEEEDDRNLEENYPIPDDRTKWAGEFEVGKLLNSITKPTPTEPEEPLKPKEIKIKKEIDFSDPERLERESIYYDKEVMSIKGTAFWNDNRSSKEKALAELEKHPHEGPMTADADINVPKTVTLSSEPYPERIKIPKNQQGSGLTFRIKDCYYDDDGMFLYRVPGMTK